MSADTPRETWYSLSLRELFLLVACVALAIVSLRYANGVWQTIIGVLVLVVFIAALIVAVVDRGTRQAISMGMVLAMGICGVLVALGELSTDSSSRPSHGNGPLPTTRLLNYILAGIQEVHWYDRHSGKVLPGFQATNSIRVAAHQIVRLRVPDTTAFMVIGHSWWALLLGYLGSRIARFVYWRRMRENKPLAAESS